MLVQLIAVCKEAPYEITLYVNVSRLVLQLPLPNLLKPGVKSRMKMPQLHLSD